MVLPEFNQQNTDVQPTPTRGPDYSYWGAKRKISKATKPDGSGKQIIYSCEMKAERINSVASEKWRQKTWQTSRKLEKSAARGPC